MLDVGFYFCLDVLPFFIQFDSVPSLLFFDSPTDLDIGEYVIELEATWAELWTNKAVTTFTLTVNAECQPYDFTYADIEDR